MSDSTEYIAWFVTPPIFASDEDTIKRARSAIKDWLPDADPFVQRELLVGMLAYMNKKKTDDLYFCAMFTNGRTAVSATKKARQSALDMMHRREDERIRAAQDDADRTRCLECDEKDAHIKELEASNRRYAQQEEIHRIAARQYESTIQRVHDACDKYGGRRISTAPRMIQVNRILAALRKKEDGDE